MLPVKLSQNIFFTGLDASIGAAAQQLTGRSLVLKRGVIITCTTGTVYIGPNSGVTSATGYPLVAAADKTVEVFIDDPSKVWIIGDAPAQAYKWVAS